MSSELQPFEHRGFVSTPHWSEEDGLWYGKIDNIQDLVNYEAEDFTDTYREFVKAVEDYISYREDLWRMKESRNGSDRIVCDILRNVGK